MADMSEYADQIRSIIQEAMDEMLDFGIEYSSPCGVSVFVIRDGSDEEVIF